MKDKPTNTTSDTATLVTMQQHYSGPLPPSQEFKAYGEVLPSAPERILSMAEAEQKHRHWKENFAIVIRSINSVLGMLFGVAIVVLCLWLAYKLATNGHDWLAGSVIAITTGCATVFVIRRAPSKEK